MSNVIPFRTRKQLEKEKQEKIEEEWLEFLEFEKKHANYSLEDYLNFKR